MANDTNIFHINLIEGLVSEIHGHLDAISPTTVEQAETKDTTRNKLASLERVELHELRKEYEQ